MKSQEILKIAGAVVLICAGLGAFYWQTTRAQAEHVANWGMANAKEININSKVSGRVIEILVDEGDSVKQGQILARIDKDFQEPQQRQAQAALREQIDALQSQLDSVNLNIKETEILAPFDGIITKKYIETGALISSVVPLFAIQDPHDNWVDFKIKETEVNKYKIGDK